VTDLVALREALAAEQAIVYGYGVVGAHLAGKYERLAAARLVIHQNRRDQIASLITGLGAVPPPSQPAYKLPYPVTGAVTAKRLAAQLEVGAAGAAWDLAAATESQSSARDIAVDWLTDAAIATSGWDLEIPSLPGRPGATAAG
jgi:hypothetical protein